MSDDDPDIVYGTREDQSVVMSERVQNLASSIYKEFERMIQTYDEDVVKELMPLVVGILEGLDHSYKEKQENEVDLELLRDDNEQLLTQYEREKQLRKTADQKCLELEDQVEEERKELQATVENLESNVRMFELKAKNAQDHIARLEEKETEMKKEYTKVHDRYTELLKTHMDYMERTKLMLGGDHRIMDCGSSPRGGKGFQLPILRPVNPSIYSEGNTPIKTGTTPPNEYDLLSPGGRSSDSNVSLKHELRGSNKSKAQTVSTGQITDNLDMKETSTGTSASAATAPPAEAELPSPEVPAPKPEQPKEVPVTPVRNLAAGESLSTTQDTGVSSTAEESLDPGYAEMITSPDMMEEIDDSGFGPTKSTPLPSSAATSADAAGNESSVFEELSRQDLGEIDDGMDITGMSKEVENLILENTELLATKNALNVVKDDLIAKVDELSSEQEILREEIMALQANKEKLRKRVSELEDDLKKAKEELDKLREKGAGVDDGADEDIPMAQRKRFTRVEMARVLMERNQYKERLMELQEAVRWTEMIRASREHPDLASSQPQSKKKGNIWNFFSNLFSTAPVEKPKTKKGLPSASVKYNAPTSGVKAIGDPNKKNRDKYNMGEKAKAYDFLQDDLMTEKARKERERERKEQYKQVRAHVKKDDGRMQAYGWSLPAKFPALGSSSASNKDGSSSSSKSQVPVPVPVYCRPLIDKESNMKIWCAAGVNISMGRTKDGGSVVGASVFYADSKAAAAGDNKGPSTEVEKLNQELKEHEKAVREGEEAVEAQSSLLWICTTEHNSSQVTVVDANNPGDILDAFHVTSSHILCIASVPGAVESDYSLDLSDIECESEHDGETSTTTATTVQDSTGATDQPPAPAPATAGDAAAAAGETKIGGVTFVQCATGGIDSKPSSSGPSPVGSPPRELASDLSQEAQKNVAAKTEAVQNLANAVDPNAAAKSEPEESETARGSEEDEGSENASGPSTPTHIRVIKATGTPASPQPLSTTASALSSSPHRKGLFHAAGVGGGGSELIQDGLNSISAVSDVVSAETERYSSVAPTMWLGAQSGSLYVHSAVSHWKKCLHSVKLKDSILNIVHLKGRVFVALADGTVAVFHRSQDGQWDLKNYHVVDLGRPHNSVRCICVVASKHLWCGYRNKVHVLDPKTLKVQKSFDAHPRKESNIRQMAWVGDGVWVSIRLDSTLRLYHAYTHQHLQDVDIEPYVSKMLGTGKLGFSFVRITSLLVSCNRLWIGTGNGVIISVPLSEANKQAVTKSSGGSGRPGGVIRVYSDSKTDSVTPGSFIPYCSMAQAQLSFHGHKDAVKFFVAVPGTPRRSVSNVPSKSDEKKKAGGGGEAKSNMLVISGGEGYIDFRLGDAESDGEASEEPQEKKPSGLSKGDRSHLIVWQVLSNTPTTPPANTQ